MNILLRLGRPAKLGLNDGGRATCLAGVTCALPPGANTPYWSFWTRLFSELVSLTTPARYTRHRHTPALIQIGPVHFHFKLKGFVGLPDERKLILNISSRMWNYSWMFRQYSSWIVFGSFELLSDVLVLLNTDWPFWKYIPIGVISRKTQIFSEQIYVIFTYKYSSYLRVNTFIYHYNDQPVSAVYVNSLVLKITRNT